MGFIFINQNITSQSNETNLYKGNLNSFNIRKREEAISNRELIGDVIGGLLEVGASIFTFGSSFVTSLAARTTGIIARSAIKNTAFIASTASKIVKTTATAAITGTIGLTKDFISGKTAGEAFSRYGTLIGSAAATGFVGGLIKQPLSKVSLKIGEKINNSIKLKNLLGKYPKVFNTRFELTSKSVDKIDDILKNYNFENELKRLGSIEKVNKYFLKIVENNFKKVDYGKLIKLNIFNKSTIIDDILSGGLLSKLGAKLQNLIRKFLNKKITESVLYKKSIELLNQFDTELSDGFKILKQLEQKELTSFKDFQNKFSFQNILDSYNKYFQRNYEELQNRLQTDLSSVESLKLEQDMNNYVLESNGASPFENDGKNVIDINKRADDQNDNEGKFGSKWILGWKWYPDLDEEGEIIYQGNGNLRVFFKSRIPKTKIKTIKRGKNKGKKVNRKAMKGSILFLNMGYDKMIEFTEHSEPGSFYWYNFAKRPLKGGGKSKGWEDRRYADIDFLNKINQDKRDRLIKQWGLGNRGITTTLTRKLGYLSATKINFKYYNTQKAIKTVFRSPAANIKKGISNALSIKR